MTSCSLLFAMAVSLGAGPARAASGMAKIKATTEGQPVQGTVWFLDTREGLKVIASLTGLPPGTHGFHIHEFGDCDEVGNSAGGHYNPYGAPHGMAPQDGIKKAHAGDMGNINAAADGTARVEVVIPKLKLTGDKNSVAGRAVVVHEKPDDFSQPAGNAGARIGCGAIVITSEQEKK